MSLAAVIALVDDKVRSMQLGAELANTDIRDRAIVLAVHQYGLDSPRQLWHDETAVSGNELPVPTAWQPGGSLLLAVEYPIGRVPRVELEAAVTLNGDGDAAIVLASANLNAATVRVHFTGPHRCDAQECTIPAVHFHAVACWAAAELCLQLATAKGHERDASISAAAVAGGSASGEMSRRARDWQREYRHALGLADPDKTNPRPAGAVVTFNSDRPRPRLYSKGW